VRWITIREAIKLVRESDPDGRGVSRWQLRRRLKSWDKDAGGKLLRWRGIQGGVLEVNAVVLQQLLKANPLERERELGEVHDRIDGVIRVTNAVRRKVRKHQKELEDQKELIVAIAEANGANSRVFELLSRGKTGGTSGHSGA